MIADIILSLQNGFENRGLVIPYLFKYNYYDCCIKVGNDVSPQKTIINGKLENLEVFPVMITKMIPCLIGIDTIIDIEKFKKEIRLIQTFIDLDACLCIIKNAAVKVNDVIFFLDELDSSRILNLFGFIPNLISIDDFLKAYKHPFIEGSGGFFNIDGKDFNRFKSKHLTQSSISLNVVSPRYVGNVIGIINMFEVFKNYNLENNELLYSYVNNSYLEENQIIYKDFLLSYAWLNLEKVNEAIKRVGVNVVCCYGINLIQNIENFVITIGNKEKEFSDVKNSLNEIKTFIIDYLKLNSQITEIMFF